jgi:hypothetical protein
VRFVRALGRDREKPPAARHGGRARTFLRQRCSCVTRSRKWHESKIHVQLLMAVKERHSRIVGDEVEFDLLEAAGA